MGDKFNETFPILRTDDLLPRNDDLPTRLSVLMSINNFRRGQLARSLECLCRQDWKEFEVLVCDNGSPENLQEVFDIFRPFLRLRTVRLESRVYSACPSRGFRKLIPMAQGEVIAIMQPEIMLHPHIARFMHDAHFNDWSNMHSYKIALSQISMEGRPRWVIPKVGFFNEASFEALDGVDWHDDLKRIEGLAQFMTHFAGLGRVTNGDVRQRKEYPWWFVASAKRDADIWKELPLFNVHANIDQWLMTYRRMHEYVDVCTRELAGYHQWHHRGRQGAETSEVVPEILATGKEKATWLPLGIGELKEMCRSYDLDTSRYGDDQRCFDNLWRALLETRKLQDEIRSSGPILPLNEPSSPLPEMSVRVRRTKESSDG